VRKFSVDLFVRVALRDEDMELLSASGCTLEKPVNVITDFLRQDLVIGDRRYHFLGCSNSQMREHGFWMYASDGKHTVDSIRQWMGDLSHERCVATYVSRLGQFFSASLPTFTVEERSKRLIPDVKRNNYCFTDGIGKISKSLGQKVCAQTFSRYKNVVNAIYFLVYKYIYVKTLKNLISLYRTMLRKEQYCHGMSSICLMSLGYSLSEDPNIMDHLQREPHILAGIGVRCRKWRFSAQKL